MRLTLISAQASALAVASALASLAVSGLLIRSGAIPTTTPAPSVLHAALYPERPGFLPEPRVAETRPGRPAFFPRRQDGR